MTESYGGKCLVKDGITYKVGCVLQSGGWGWPDLMVKAFAYYPGAEGREWITLPLEEAMACMLDLSEIWEAMVGSDDVLSEGEGRGFGWEGW